MNENSAKVAPDVDEFALTGVSTLASMCIQAPRVAESPVSFECRDMQMLQLQSAQAHCIDTWLELGDVKAVHMARHVLVNGIRDNAAAHLWARGGVSAAYFEVSESAHFQMERPL